MLRFEYIPGNEEAQKIIKAHINNRLIALMEGIILDEVDWNLAMDGELENIPEDASFEDLVDVDALMNNMDFAENVSMSYLPDNYPIEKANREFFGLYKLLKAKNEYVPELPMEYVLYNVIMNEVWQIDMINEDTEEGVFDDLMDDPFFEGIEDEEYTTIERIPEPERSIALAGIREDAKDEAADRFGNGYTDSDLDVVAEELLTEHEDLRQYEEICFWDTDFAFLDDCDEDTLIRSQAGEFMGLGERQDVKKMEMEIGGNTVKMEVNIAPWEMENWVAEG